MPKDIFAFAPFPAGVCRQATGGWISCARGENNCKIDKMRFLRLHLPPTARRRTVLSAGLLQMVDAQDGGARAQGSLPKSLNELASWVGSSKDGKEAGLRLVKLGDDFARIHGENLSPSLRNVSVKVPGCVSVVRIAVSRQPDSAGGRGRLVIEGEADARVARGMLALLAEGLRNADVDEVMKVHVDELIKVANLRQFLPPGRNNGLANMLSAIKTQAAAAKTAAAAAASASGLPPLPSDTSAASAVTPQTQHQHTKPHNTNNTQTNAAQVWAWGGRAEEVAMLLSGGVDSSVSV